MLGTVCVCNSPNLLLQDGLWLDLLKRQFVFKSSSKKWAEDVKTTHLMIKTFDDPKHEELLLDAVNMELVNNIDNFVERKNMYVLYYLQNAPTYNKFRRLNRLKFIFCLESDLNHRLINF